jgi:DNA-3-methyladenine glycosylase
MRLTEDFYKKTAIELAPELLGRFLCRKLEDKVVKYRITETECYYTESDTACHANKGKTERTKVLYKTGGRAYVYLCYGIHNLFNIVTGEEGVPQAVLIRGIEGYDGPGKLTKALQIDRSLNDEDLITSDKIWLESNGYFPKYKTTKRIGIDYATEEYRNKLWRYIVENVEKD